MTSLNAFPGAAFGPIGSDWSDSGPRPGGRLFRADLHVHSRFSGPGHFGGVGARAGAGEPEEIARVARARGLDLVTLTDLNTIEGCLRLLERAGEARDIIVSEEATAFHPRFGGPVHVLLYGLTEAHHGEIQRLRGDVRELAGYARAHGIPAALSPVVGGPAAGVWAADGAEEVLDLFTLFEARNGLLGRPRNELAARRAQRAAGAGRRAGLTGGSGAHGPARVGRTVTVSTAGTPDQFLADLREGRTWASGELGGFRSGAMDLSRLIAAGYHGLLAGDEPGGGRDLRGAARMLLALPLDALGAPLWGHGLRSARAGVHVRQARRRLDRQDLTRFQARARTLAPAHPSGAPAPYGCAGGPARSFESPGLT